MNVHGWAYRDGLQGEYFTLNQACKLLDVTSVTLARMIKDGEVLTYRVGQRVRVPKAQFAKIGKKVQIRGLKLDVQYRDYLFGCIVNGLLASSRQDYEPDELITLAMRYLNCAIARNLPA